MKNVVVLGSTGSIGQAALEIISQHPEKFTLFGIAGNKQKELMLKQIQRFQPAFAVFNDESASRFENIKKTRCLYGQEGLEFLATCHDTDVVVMAISGLAGLSPTFKALDAGKTVALATKEVIVCAGHLLSGMKGKILPVDSEHNAIFQMIEKENISEVKRIILTASGGPFLSYRKSLSDVTVEQVLNHPIWKMGKRITVDSATMMNKGFEIIEAFYLFNIRKESIDVVLHPQAIVHAFVVFCDGFMKAILSRPDMKYSINFCLNYPERVSAGFEELDISGVRALTFEAIESGRFPCFDLARDALEMGGSYLTVLNAADEESVRLFLDGLIGFDSIPVIVEKSLENHKAVVLNTIDEVLQLDKQVRAEAKRIAASYGLIKNT
ncbi:MAG: 1-deoxy-D-xylulose-5-phosphate reductoisomerase [Candidatus Omnitrophica bacterium]|nr:1-deoxy-D-xylulose-5-phosphate reductoisomerase [Candidatus Omnitrophota bacterium]MCM8789164.1 1-deoxy-D-xylulose-5-phosphate reductoisomerase [Candidatus Omnitrophota bacterium]